MPAFIEHKKLAASTKKRKFGELAGSSEESKKQKIIKEDSDEEEESLWSDHSPTSPSNTPPGSPSGARLNLFYDEPWEVILSGVPASASYLPPSPSYSPTTPRHTVQ